MSTQYLQTDQKRHIAYQQLAGAQPGVCFLSGFNSNMQGSKALALEEFCRKAGRAFTRFDYSGHGESSGAFQDGCIGDWMQDALAVLDALTTGPQILVGSSMGAWIALLIARARPERVHALVGIAPAPDFTERLIWQQLSDAQKNEMQEKGVIYLPSCYGEEPYAITHKLVEEGRKHLLLSGSTIPITCPVRLIHGTRDEDVPWQLSTQLIEHLQSDDVQLTLIKGAGHRLSEPEQLEIICNSLSGVW